MGTRELVLALAIVGAVAWTARAGDGRSMEERVASLEAQVGARDGSAKSFGDGFRAIEARLDRLEGASRTAAELEDPRLEDPRKVEPPKGASERALVLYGEWVGAYVSARMKQMRVDTLARSQGDLTSATGEILARDLRIARQELAVLIAECDKAREAYRGAVK